MPINTGDTGKSADSVDAEFAEGWMNHLPGVDPTVEAARQRIHKLARLLERVLADTAAEHEVTVGDWEALAVLQRAGPPHECLPKELAGRLGVTSGTMSVRIERLTKAGLVEPSSGDDGRSRPVRLTTRGSDLWHTATTRRTATEHRLMTGALGEDELADLSLLLGRLLAGFEHELGTAPSQGAPRGEVRPS